jgi:hypothetical protein
VLNAVERFEQNTDPSERAKELQDAIHFGRSFLGSIGYFARTIHPKNHIEEMNRVVQLGRQAIASAEENLSKS